MRGNTHPNWWKSAAVSEEQHDAMFKKLMAQYYQREDQARQMLGLLLSDRAPKWFSDRLEEWVIAQSDIPADHWTMKWIAHRLEGSEGEANDLRKMVRFTGFTGITYRTWNWMRHWCDGLAPGAEPTWFGKEVIRHLDRHQGLPEFTQGWAKAKLESGQDDDVRRALHDTIRHHLDRTKKYSGELGRAKIDWYPIPSWGREYAKKMLEDDLRDGGGQS
jgi:hypothetical protein